MCKNTYKDFKQHNCSKMPEGYVVETAIFSGYVPQWVWCVTNENYFGDSVHGILCCPFCGEELGSAEPDGNVERGESES